MINIDLGFMLYPYMTQETSFFLNHCNSLWFCCCMGLTHFFPSLCLSIFLPAVKEVIACNIAGNILRIWAPLWTHANLFPLLTVPSFPLLCLLHYGTKSLWLHTVSFLPFFPLYKFTLPYPKSHPSPFPLPSPFSLSPLLVTTMVHLDAFSFSSEESYKHFLVFIYTSLCGCP